jgi:hypothetical protein
MRGVNERQIRRYIENGALAGAILPDGSIDPDIADVKLSAAKVGGERVASNLVKARARKLGAAVALLADEVAELEAAVAPIADVRETVRRIAVHIAGIVWPLAGLAPQLAGLERSAAITVLEDEVRARLGAIAKTGVSAPRSKPRTPPDGPSLAEMNPVDLAAERATLQARKMEIQHALARNELVDLATEQAAAVDAVLRMRGKLLAVPSKIGAHMGDTVDVTELRALLQAEVAEALAELAGPSVTRADIEAARDQAAVGPSTDGPNISQAKAATRRPIFKLQQGRESRR